MAELQHRSADPATTRTTLLAFLALAAVATIDYVTGREISFSVFYVGPVALVAWYAPRRLAHLAAWAAAIVWLFVEVNSGPPFSSAWIPLWNMLVRLGFFIIIAILVSERQRVLHDAIRNRHRAEEAVRTKEAFIAHVSHEIRTPLNAVIGLSELLRQAPDAARRQHYVEKIQSAGQVLLAVVNDILDSARLERGQLQLEHIDFDLGVVIARAKDLFADICAGKGVVLSADIATGVWTRVTGDPLRLGQIVNNLVSNAVKYTAAGEISVSVASDAAAAPSGSSWYVITVADTGLGMNASTLANVFEPFTQADTSVARRFGGSGLGLSISTQLAQLMGGTLTAESAPGRGSAFRLRIPLVLQPERASDARDPPGSISNAGVVTTLPHVEVGRRSHRPTVLLVEDNAINQEVACALLENYGYSPVVDSSGEAALMRLESGCCRVDAILMDVQLPGIDGLETTRRLRDLPGMQSVPIIGLSASVGRGDFASCIAAGMNDFVPKPIQSMQLAAALARWVDIPVSGTGLRTADSNPRDSATEHAGLDVDGALRRIGGDEKLLTFVWTRLLGEWRAGRADLRGAIASGDHVRVGQLAHTFKSLFAQAGATAASAALEDLQRRAVSGTLGEPAAELAAIDAGAASLMLTMAAYAPTLAETVMDDADGTLEEWIARVRDQLERHDLQALSDVPTLARKLASRGLDTAAEALERHVDRLEFELALSALSGIGQAARERANEVTQ